MGLDINETTTGGRPWRRRLRSLHRRPGRQHGLTTAAAMVAVVAGSALTTGASEAYAAGPSPAYAAAVLPQGLVADDAPIPGKLLLLLDASGSMNEKDPSGLTKIAAAKKALVSVVDDLPDTAQVGLRVYGATQTGGKPTPAACADTQLVHPITPLDKPGLTTAINRFQAKGETPIAYSLQKALTDLGSTGKRNIVLVSDGQESCVPDPCPAITKVIGTGVDLQIDTVGFAVNATARRQLQCIADAGHGSYYDASDAGQLDTSLSKLSQRALRPFTVSGTRVTGTADNTVAPVLEPGLYQDQLTLKSAPLHYRIHRTIPGSTIRVSAALRPVATVGDWNTQRINMKVLAEDGTTCASDTFYRLEFGGHSDGVLTGAEQILGRPSGKPEDTECVTGNDLDLSVERVEGVPGAMPMEILVIEEPPTDASVTGNKDSRPEPPLRTPASSGTPVIGGAAFTDAAIITPGTWQDSILLGEQTFYRVRLEEGQQAVLTVRNPGRKGADLNIIEVDSYAVDRFDLTPLSGTPSNTTSLGLGGDYARALTPTVRYDNRWTLADDSRVPFYEVRHASIPGFYYFSVSAGRTPSLTTSAPVPLVFRLDVLGTPTSPPQAAATASVSAGTSASGSTPSGTPAAAATSKPSSSTTPLPYVAGGLALLLAIGGAGFVLVRRRRSSSAS